MAEEVVQKPKRIFYIDNLRLFLTILVVLHHVAVAYGGSGGWPLKEDPTDDISPIILTLFNAINQSFFLSLFYMLSGYFVSRSYDKKGPAKFIKDRLIRLGIPLLVYTTLIITFIDFMIINFARGETVSIFRIVSYKVQHPHWVIGPLWFVEGLLIFSIIYAIVKIITKSSFKPFKDTFPSNSAILISIIAIAAMTFLVRLRFPVGYEVHVFQLGHFVHYSFCFWVGILASRGKWFDNLSRSQARTWNIAAVVATLLLPVLFALGGGRVEPFLGGFSWQSLVLSFWESFACLSIIISLLYMFRTRFNDQGKLLKWMSPNFYIVYILHQPVIVSIMIPFLYVDMPTPLKFLFVALIGVSLCFVLGNLIRKIPFTKKVLG
jgi:fucose 4-O-acetylase-like acetyltransferase